MRDNLNTAMVKACGAKSILDVTIVAMDSSEPMEDVDTTYVLQVVRDLVAETLELLDAIDDARAELPPPAGRGRKAKRQRRKSIIGTGARPSLHLVEPAPASEPRGTQS
jgi:hypothetical protein